MNEFRQRFTYQGPVILLVDGHLAHVTPGSWLLRVEPYHTHSTGCTQLSHLASVQFVRFRDFRDSGSKGEADERNERRDTKNLQLSFLSITTQLF
jgi:hypothetical protein